MHRVVTADRGDAGRRLDLVLRRHLADVTAATRTRVQSWIEGGLVTVNGLMVRRVSARAGAGDCVAIDVPDLPARHRMSAEPIDLDILYEDDYFLAINKPAGVVVHPTFTHRAGTLMNALLWHAREWPAPQRPSLVGRLDKLTSGLVIVAKTADAHARLQRATSSRASAHDCEKEYVAVVYGKVNVPRGQIDFPLAHDSIDRRRIVPSEYGAPSLTRFERMAFTPAPCVGLTLLKCRLVTGRRHQLRVHLLARGWPIVGDPTYGQPFWSRVIDASLRETLRAFPRQALHACRLALTHPVGGHRVVIEAPLPRDLDDLVSATSLRVQP